MLSSTLENMKNALNEKFKNNVVVKPLYKKLKNGNKIKPKILITVDSTFELDGDGISVKKSIVNNSSSTVRQKHNISNVNRTFMCGARDNFNKDELFEQVNRKHVRDKLTEGNKMLKKSDKENRKSNCEVEGIEDKINKFVQADNKIVVIQKVENTWLRLYPLPKLPKESVHSVIFRCILCQLGLFTVLILWTIIWVFVIHSFEGPYEIKVSLDFDKSQNQLIIDLATELRQITPLSPKWKSAIERRIQDERHLTMEAVSHGARVHPGQFWDLSGTFLFTVYVMTALGFGAPVPQTLWGRTTALIYAIFAVPTHVYLMWNTSMCIVVHVEAYLKQLRCTLRDKRPVLGRTTFHNGSESPNCSRNSEVLKTPNRSGIAKLIMRLLSVLGACRSVPLAAILYYVCGAAVFGLARGNTSLDITMFPLEFTTGGGLDRVEGHVRILYGFYVEGATMLLACGLATLRRHSGAAITCMTEKYRLFESEH